MVRSPRRGLAERSARLRIGPFREGAFTSDIHRERTAAILGIALGVTFGVCFITGLLSHLIQHPPGWFRCPAHPAWLYRLNQGLHVMTGIASIPLLLGKLWVAYPRFWVWPPVRSAAHALERLSLVPLVGGSIFLLVTGLLNIDYWYAFRFSFPPAHYAAAWITIGALLVHIGAKATVARTALSRRAADTPAAPTGGLGRRAFLGVIGGAAALAVLTIVGETVTPLRRLALLAPRNPGVGPQGLPVNRTAAAARVLDVARDKAYRLTVRGRVARPLELSLEQLGAMPQREVALPIACVEGWSATAHWRGVSLADLLAEAGAGEGSSVLVASLEPKGNYRTSTLDPGHAHHPDTLLAMEVNGEPLHIDHGYPLRLIAPSNPGVLQTKWVQEVVVL